MITVRHYTKADLDAICQMHAKQGFDYEMPQLEDELMTVRCVLEEDGEPQMAAFLRTTCEAYLFLDPAIGTKRNKIGKLLTIHEAVRDAAQMKGYSDVHVWLPPNLDRFGKLLMHLGWRKQLWQSYSRQTR
jgi:hypothetical protein